MKTFIHIPKTGGTTIVHTLSRQILYNRFQRLNPTRFTHPKDFLEKVEGLLENVITSSHKIEVVGGHFGFAAHPKLSDPSQHFTVLRDPIERVISEYYYMKHKGMYYQHLINNENLDLEDYIHHPEISYLNNLQTRLVAGESYQSGDIVTEVVYSKALKNLKKFQVFGLTEQMSDTLALFYLTLGWKRLPYYLEANINDKRPRKEDVSEKAIMSIKEREKYDIMLYKEAKEIFNSKLMEREEEINRVIVRILKPSYIYKFYLKALNKFFK
ncbi:MAG: sulfotransferase family 2 domain-containing protein [Cyclobacteriaceae bacterium]